MSPSVIAANEKANTLASAIGAELRLRIHDIAAPTRISPAIFQNKFRPCQASCSLSRVVRSNPISRNALTIEAEGPKVVEERFAPTIAAKYKKT
jgi:hypothetical protein